MTVYVKTHNEVPGFHFWENAPDTLDFLRFNHRHIFVITCLFLVDHEDRAIELFVQQKYIETFLRLRYPPYSGQSVDGLQFGGISCETIARKIIEEFDHCIQCEVQEDGKGGALVRR